MSRWRLFHPQGWIPQHFEEIFYRPPNGDHVRSGRLIRCDVQPGHHRIAIGRHIFDADVHDIFPQPGWHHERELMAIEEASVPEESVEAMEGW
jgi:hypothetical protein